MKFKVMTAIFALALIAGAATMTPRTAVASANSGGDVEATFTKWIIGDSVGGPDKDLFDMFGVVGGEVGRGTFFGEVFSLVDDGTTTTIHAVYHVNGSKQSFVAHLTIKQNDASGIADIAGVVRGGPLDGARVDGGYRTLSTCDIPTPGNIYGQMCFKGSLNVTP